MKPGSGARSLLRLGLCAAAVLIGSACLAAERGDANGLGVAKNPARAIELYRKAAKSGNAAAQNSLGLLYYQGRGAPQDYVEAAGWFRKAAELGNPLAQYNLASMYRDAFGVARDMPEAMRWFRKSAEQGDADAQESLGRIYFDGLGAAQDYAEAMRWFRKAAEQGNAQAQFALGWAYDFGNGVKPDVAEATKWYLAAARQGHAAGETKMGHIYYSGTPWTKKDHSEALRWYRSAAEHGDQRALVTLRSLAMADKGGEEARAVLKELARKPGVADKASERAGASSPGEIERQWAEIQKNPLLTQARRSAEKRDHRAALEKAEACIQEARAKFDTGLVAACQVESARASMKLKVYRYEHVDELLNRALSLHTARGDPKGIASVLSALASLAGDRSNRKLEISYARQALEIYERTADADGISSSCRVLAMNYAALGRFHDANDYARRSVESGRKSNDQYRFGGSLIASGDILLRIGDDAGALEAFSEAAAIMKKLGKGEALGLVLSLIASIHWTRGDLSEALAAQRQAIAAAESDGRPGGADFTRDRLAVFHLQAGDVAAAEEELARGREGKIPDWGLLSLVRKDYPNAARIYRRDIEAHEKTRADAQKLFAGYCGLGLSELGLKSYSRARDAFQKAVDLSEDEREALAPEQRAGFFSGAIDTFLRTTPYKGLVSAAAAEGDAAKAFYWAESLKARLLAEAVARGQSANDHEVPEDLKEKEETLRRTIAQDKQAMGALYLQNEMEQYREHEKALAQAKAERQRLVATLRRLYPQYAAVAYPDPIEPKDVALSKDEVLVEFAVGEEKSFLLIVPGRGKKARVREIPASRRRLRELTARYRSFFENISSTQDLAKFDSKLGHELYRLLFGDALDKLPPDSSLVIVPDEFLGVLPFESLPVSLPEKETLAQGDHGPFPLGITYLGDKFPVTYAQSAASLTLLRSLPASKEARDSALAVCDPVFSAKDRRAGEEVAIRSEEKIALMGALSRWKTMGAAGTKARNRGPSDDPGAGTLFPRLEKTRLIAEKLSSHFGDRATVLSGSAATQEAVLKLPLSRYKYVVLATHGILSGDIPFIREPALVLSQVGNTEGHSGFLTMSQVMGLKIPAEVVALPACQTGVGKNVSGEGVMGMGRAFQYAGSKNVMMSLYSVAEDATVALTIALFDRLAEGASPREALLKARKDIRRQGYENPFYWSAFILMGN